MHQMRGCVITARGVALFHINVSLDYVPDRDFSFDDFHLVHNQTLCGRIGVNDLGQHLRTSECAHVADLPATLCIERSLIEDEFAFLTFSHRGDFITLNYAYYS